MSLSVSKGHRSGHNSSPHRHLRFRRQPRYSNPGYCQTNQDPSPPANKPAAPSIHFHPDKSPLTHPRASRNSPAPPPQPDPPHTSEKTPHSPCRYPPPGNSSQQNKCPRSPPHNPAPERH